MASNSFGQHFRITTFGESHGVAIGVIVDGCPAGVTINLEKIQAAVDRRRPGQSAIVTQRDEKDRVEILSGTWEGKSTGTPIFLMIRNEDAKSKDYSHIANIFRPSHADFTYQEKYGLRDYRGGGRSSARETAARVAAGAIAMEILASKGIKVWAYTQQVGDIVLSAPWHTLDANLVESNPVRCPDPHLAEAMETLIRAVRKEGDTIGGVVQCVVEGLPIGLGQPVFHKLHADLGHAILGINACKGFEYGSGFDGVKMKGSAHNDAFYVDEDGIVRTSSNHSGGVQGGISNGMPIYFKAAFKPVATIVQEQKTIDKDKNSATAEGKGRHDPCVVPRAVPIVEAMTALVLADHLLWMKGDKI